MSGYPSNWIMESESGAATLKRGGHSEQSTYTDIWIVKLDPTASTIEANSHFSTVLDGGGGVIIGRYGPYVFNFESYDAKHLGNGVWRVEAQYVTSGGGEQEAAGNGNAGGEMPIGVVRSVNYNSTGSTQHITSGLSEKRTPNDAADMKAAIGVNGDNVEGVDVVVPVFEWTEEYEVPGRNINFDYFKTCAALTGTINNETFRGFDPGEVLFLGLAGGSTYNPNQQIESDVASTKLSFRFAAKKNEDVTVGGLTISPSNGWDYVWIKYDDDAANGVGLKKPVAIYSNQVYKKKSFRPLRLP